MVRMGMMIRSSFRFALFSSSGVQSTTSSTLASPCTGGLNSSGFALQFFQKARPMVAVVWRAKFQWVQWSCG